MLRHHDKGRLEDLGVGIQIRYRPLRHDTAREGYQRFMTLHRVISHRSLSNEVTP